MFDWSLMVQKTASQGGSGPCFAHSYFTFVLLYVAVELFDCSLVGRALPFRQLLVVGAYRWPSRRAPAELL
jgi:hypothetical protein